MTLEVKSSNALLLSEEGRPERLVRLGDVVEIGGSGWRLTLTPEAYCCGDEADVAPATMATAASEEGPMTQTPAASAHSSNSAVHQFLDSAGLGTFKAHFDRESLTELEDVMLLPESDLAKLGIDKLGLVKKFQRAVTALAVPVSPAMPPLAFAAAANASASAAPAAATSSAPAPDVAPMSRCLRKKRRKQTAT